MVNLEEEVDTFLVMVDNLPLALVAFIPLVVTLEVALEVMQYLVNSLVVFKDFT